MSAIGHSAKDCIITADGIDIKGFADGDFFSFEPAQDAVTKTVGSDGEVAFSDTNDESGTVTITLMAGAPSNRDLMGLYNTKAVFELSFENLNGGSSFFCRDARIGKLPPLTAGRENGTTEWMILCAHARVSHGAAARVGV